MNLYIDGSNILAGGGKTHLVELIKHAEPIKYGFNKVVVYGHDEVIKEIPPKVGLVKKTPLLFGYGYFGRLLWKLVVRKSTQNGIWFVPGAGSAPGRYVTMCQNLLSIDVSEQARYFFSWTWVRLVVLGFFHQIAFRKAAGVIFLNQFCFEILPKVTRQKITKTAIIPHGVSEIFTALPRTEKDIKTFKLIYVSTIDLYKHQWKIAEAVDELLKEGYAIRIDFIGHANPRAMVKLNPFLSESIRYLGPVSYRELPARYAASDAFIFGSTCETFGMVLLEAMACGLPILSSNRSSMPETLGDHALYFDPLDVVTIKQAILKLYKNYSLYKSLQEDGIEFAKQFAWEKTSYDTFKFIQECCMLKYSTGAIDYHNREAKTFKEKYQDKQSFKKRLLTWEHLIRGANSKFDRAMDIGCGPGWMTKILCDVSNSVVAIDGAARMLEQSRATVGDAADQVEFIEAAIVPSLFDRWPSKSFDLIISSSVLEYVENAELILKKSFEVLSPSGTLIFSLPNASSWFRMIETNLFRWLGKPIYRGLLVNVWNDKDTVKMLERIGFKVDTVLWQGYVPYFSEIFFWLPKRLRKPMMIIVAKK